MNTSRPSFEDLPSAVEAPPSPEPSRVAAPRPGLSRRHLLRAATGVGVAAGLGLLDLFPWSRPRLADAAAYQQWSDCHSYFSNSTTICVPTSAYYGSNNCSGSWHKQDLSQSGCIYHRYSHNPTSCAGRNAWRWTGSSAHGPHRKCSDGWYWFRDCTGPTSISMFSICRTAIA